MATSEFPSFPRLPPEIRLMIWNAALPGPINNPLFFWRTDKVIKHRLDDKYDDYDNWVPDLIHPLEMGIFSVEIPLLEVSKEAHKVAQVWVQRQSPSLEVDVDNDTYTENHNRLAMRRFNPRRDIVFCPDDKWKDFLGEIWNIFYVLSIEGPGRYPEHYNLIRRVALPQQMLMDSRLAPLRKVFSMGVQLWCRNLYVVVDAPAALRGAATRNWGLEILDDFPRASCTRPGGWRITEGCAAHGGTAYESARELLEQIVKYNFPEEKFRESALREFPMDFEIQFVRAVEG